MDVGGKGIDGRLAKNGAQMINCGRSTHIHNAKFAMGSGGIHVTSKNGIQEGQEILMGYGEKYWRDKKKGDLKRDATNSIGGCLTYTTHQIDEKRIIKIETKVQ